MMWRKNSVQTGVSFRSLWTLQFRQIFRSGSRHRFYVDIIGIVYFWIMELIVFFAIREEGVEVPSPVIPIITVSFLIPDFIMKLIFIHDNTVMDAFLKTRPVSQEKWNRFLTLSQFCQVSNLMLPLMVVPLCYMYLSFIAGTALFLFIYLASVFGGFMVMLIKHRGTYQSEKMVRNYLAHSVRPAGGSHIFNIQSRSFLRSKRLRNSTIYLCILFYLQVLCYSVNPDKTFFAIFLFLFLFCIGIMIPQYGFAVEANFFAGIRTRPAPLSRFLRDKYFMGIVTGAAGLLLCLPLCIWIEVSVLTLLSDFLFVVGFGNLLVLCDAYDAVPLDLFGNTFGNHQGAHFKVSSLISAVAIIAVGYLTTARYPGWLSQLMLSLAGLAGIVWHKSFFKWIEARFEKKKYKYMTQYMKK